MQILTNFVIAIFVDDVMFLHADRLVFSSFQVEVLTQAPRATTVHAIRFVCFYYMYI